MEVEKTNKQFNIKDYQVFSASTIKILAMISMLIDHMALAFVESAVLTGHTVSRLGMTYDEAASLNTTLRGIGRLAFPIFCFMIAEGAVHTKSMRKYLLRLLAFSLISEIPFDLMRTGNYFDWTYQNVGWTLLSGALAIATWNWLLDPKRQKTYEHSSDDQVLSEFQKFYLADVLNQILAVAMIVIYASLVTLAATDYMGFGTVLIFLMYLLRDKPVARFVAGTIVLLCIDWFELAGIITFALIALYNGKKGWKLKYLFYAFYPLHMLIIAILAKVMWG